MEKSTKQGILLAILAAALYAISAPLSKLLLDVLPPMLTAGLLYLGAGIGMAAVGLVRNKFVPKIEARLTKKELPYAIAMVLLDIAAPICLMFGLKETAAENAALLNNFEIVATAVVALVMCKEAVSKRLWIAIALITVAGFVLSFENISQFTFSYGSLLVLLACVSWGFENNCTRKMSSKDPLQIVVIKGIFSGLGSVVIGLFAGEIFVNLWSVFAALGLGFAAYGLSIFCYVYAQRQLGAARTSAYYAVAPFIGVLLSWAIFQNTPGWVFLIALALMVFGTYFASSDKPFFRKKKRKTIDK